MRATAASAEWLATVNAKAIPTAVPPVASPAAVVTADAVCDAVADNPPDRPTGPTAEPSIPAATVWFETVIATAPPTAVDPAGAAPPVRAVVVTA